MDENQDNQEEEEAGKEEDSGQEEKEQEEEKQEQEEEIEPEVRATRAKSEESDNSGADEEEIAPEDQKTIEKIVAKRLDERLAPLEQQTLKQEIDSELANHPEYKPYEKRIRAFVTHPNRKKLIDQGLPVSTVVLEAVAPHLQEIGAAKEREAKEKADTTKGGGSTSRPKPGEAKDWRFASKEEYEAERARALNQPRK